MTPDALRAVLREHHRFLRFKKAAEHIFLSAVTAGGLLLLAAYLVTPESAWRW